MGAGLAKHITDRYPFVREEYMRARPIIGSVLLCALPGGQSLANLYAQYYVRHYVGECCTDYGALKMALSWVRDYAVAGHHSSVAIPYGMGCGLAGGDWGIVLGIISEVFGESEVAVEIWRLPT